MARFCRACGTALNDGDRFCEECGTKVSRPAAATAAPPAATEAAQAEPPARLHAPSPAEAVSAEPAADPLPDPIFGPVAAEDDGASVASLYDERFGPQEKLGALSKTLSAAPAYFILYFVFGIPTYILPYFGSNSAITNGISSVAGAGMYPLFYAHLTFLYALTVLAWLRGALIGRPWLCVFPIFAAIFDLTPGFNWVPLVPTLFHILAVILGVSKPLLPEEEMEGDSTRVRIALIGLALLLVLTVYRIATYRAATQNALASLAASAMPQPGVPSDATQPAPPAPQPAITINAPIFGASAGPNAMVLDAQINPPADPDMLYAQWNYSGAQPGQVYSCAMDNLAPAQATLSYADGFVTCHWPKPGAGTHHFILTIADTTDNRQFDVPAAAVPPPAVAESQCLPFSLDVQTCTLNGTTRIMLAPGIGAGYVYCFLPAAEFFNRVQLVTSDGQMLDFAANRTIPATGYVFTPASTPQEIKYWLARTCS